jgi:hypothetical protein
MEFAPRAILKSEAIYTKAVPQGLKPTDFELFTHGLKPVPFMYAVHDRQLGD